MRCFFQHDVESPNPTLCKLPAILLRTSRVEFKIWATAEILRAKYSLNQDTVSSQKCLVEVITTGQYYVTNGIVRYKWLILKGFWRYAQNWFLCFKCCRFPRFKEPSRASTSDSRSPASLRLLIIEKQWS